MREKNDKATSRRMAAAMILIAVVVVTVIIGFSKLQKKQQVDISYAQDNRQEEATVKIADVYEEKPLEDSTGTGTELSEEAAVQAETGSRADETALAEEEPAARQEDITVGNDTENEDVYLVKGEEKKSNKYDRVDKLTYTDSVRYTREEVGLLDQYGLRITRNEIYARHGRMFNDQELQKYFDNQPWYVPKYSPSDFDDSCLNDVEQYNVNLLVSYEQAQGYS